MIPGGPLAAARCSAKSLRLRLRHIRKAFRGRIGGSAAAHEIRYTCVPNMADSARCRLLTGLLKTIVSAGALMIRKPNRTALIVVPQAYCLSCEEKTPHRHERLAIRGAQVARTICLACNSERGGVTPERVPISPS